MLFAVPFSFSQPIGSCSCLRSPSPYIVRCCKFLPSFFTHASPIIYIYIYNHSLFYVNLFCIFVCFRYLKKRHLIDVTEVFRFIDTEKKYRIAKLAFYLILFVLVIIRSVVFYCLLTLLHSVWVGMG